VILQDKRIVITGVMTADSIAFSVAEQAQAAA
jgi:enoyl-[acyl-carrier-protein] reductase (NADH)